MREHFVTVSASNFNLLGGTSRIPEEAHHSSGNNESVCRIVLTKQRSIKKEEAKEKDFF